MQQALFDPPPAALPPAVQALAARPEATHRQRWWRLHGDARRHGLRIEPVLVTPHFLARIGVTCCPVTREPVGPRSGKVVALHPDADLAAGHLAVLGPTAAAALAAHPGWAAGWAVAERLDAAA